MRNFQEGVAPFYPNGGQYPDGVLFAGKVGDVGVTIGQGSLLLVHAPSPDASLEFRPIEIRWHDPSPFLRVEGMDRSDASVSFFVGDDPKRWASNLPTFHRVRVRGLYPGIDVVFYANEGELEFDYVVHPGGDPRQIRWSMRHLAKAEAPEFTVRDDGSIRSIDSSSEWHLKAPTAYQGKRESDGNRVAVSFFQKDGLWCLELGEYTRSKRLVIDPLLSYSSYHGGTKFDQANAVATDSGKNIYLAGETWSLDLPVLKSVQSYRKSGTDSFLVKFASDGKTIQSATYFGGNGDDSATGLQVSGLDVFVAGETGSGDLPGTTGKYQSTNRGGRDGFITRIQFGATTAIVATTYLGGAGSDRVNAIILDADGNPYVAGNTSSSNFPLHSSFGLTPPGGPNDAFLAKLSPDLTALVWSGAYGGLGYDTAEALALGSNNSLWFTGTTSSAALQTVSALQSSLFGTYDCFLARVSSDGSSLLFSSYLGGSASENCYAIAVDGSGNPIVAGSSSSSDFPTTPGAYQTMRTGSYDNVVAKVNPSSGTLTFGTYLGGSQTEAPRSIYLDTDGAVCIAGYTLSTDYPTVTPVQPTNGGAIDGFISCLNSTGSTLLFSSYLGGADEDRIQAVVRRSDAWTVLVGLTQSANFPVTVGARQTIPAGQGDSFLTAISRTGANVSPSNVSVTPSSGTTETADLTYVLEDANGFQDIRYFYANIHNAVSTVSGCYTLYDPDSKRISLLSDDGRYWVGNALMGESKQLTNSQCIVDAAKSSVWGHASRLTVHIFYSFRAGFSGSKSILMYTQDRSNVVAGWQLRGGWVVPQLAGNVQPSVTYFQPNSGTFLGTPFVLRTVDPNGASDLRDIHLLANETLSYPSSCYVLYNQPTNQLKLLNDTTSQFLGPLTPGVSGTLENSSCILSAGYSSATKSGDSLTLAVYLSFKSGAAGANSLWTLVSDQSNAFLGWKSQGTFTVPIGPAFSRPTAQSIAVSTVGTKLRFTLTGNDDNGGEDIKDFYFLGNATLSNPNGCYVLIRRTANELRLLNDAGTNWQATGTIGTSQTVENSQCRINLAEVSTSTNGTTAQAVLDIQFKAGFSGQKSAWLYVEDLAKLASGWVFLSTFTPIAH